MNLPSFAHAADLADHANTMLALGGVLLAIAAKIWGWPVVKRTVAGFAAFGLGLRAICQLGLVMPTLSQLQAMQETLGTIRKEVLPNGGSSLRDAVNLTRDTAQRTEQALALFINSTRAQWDGMGMFGVFEADSAGDYTYVNNTLQRWLNRSEHDLLGAGWVNAIALGDREVLRNEWESCVEDVREFTMQVHLAKIDGSEFGVTITATPVLEHLGRGVAKWIGVIRRD